LMDKRVLVATDSSGRMVGVDADSWEVWWQTETGGKSNGGVNGTINNTGSMLFAGTYAGRIVSLATFGYITSSIEVDSPINGTVAFSLLHGLVAAGDCSGTLTVVNLSSLVTRHSNDEGRKTNDDTVKIDTGSYIPSHPVFAGDSLYAVTHEGTLHAFDVRDLTAPPLTVELEESFMTSPAVSGSWVVLGSSEGTVWVLERESMEIMESLETKHGPWLAPLICGDGTVLMASKDGVLAAYSLPELTELWRFNTLHEFIGGAIFYGSGIAISDADGNLFCYQW